MYRSSMQSKEGDVICVDDVSIIFYHEKHRVSFRVSFLWNDQMTHSSFKKNAQL